MATFTAIVAAVWAFLKGVPLAVYTHGGAALVGFLLRGCLLLLVAVGAAGWGGLIGALVLSLAVAAAPARGAEPCKCGSSCPAGGGCDPCLCAAPDPQRAAYDALVRRLKPGDLFQVFVHTDTGTAYVPAVRWDGYPGVTGKWVITGRIGADGPYEYGRLNLNPPPARSQPVFAPFGGSCPGGRCVGSR